MAAPNPKKVVQIVKHIIHVTYIRLTLILEKPSSVQYRRRAAKGLCVIQTEIFRGER